MKIRVCFRDGTWYDSDKYNFSFHGLDLKHNADRFFYEQGCLTCIDKKYKMTTFIPCGEITSITEIEDEVEE